MVRTKFEEVQETKEQLLIPTDKKWWSLRPDFSANKNSTAVISDVGKLREEAEYLMRIERKKYVAYKQATDKSDFNWINSVLTGGTFADRLSANTLLIQDSPVHNLFSLHKLIDIVNSKGIRECLMASDNLKDLFIGNLLLKDKKMKPFKELIAYLPPKDGPLRNKLLILFYFEDQLLTEYKRFLDILAKISIDGNDSVKSKAVNVMWELLCQRPEQESFILEKLVNKLGDPVPKRAAHVAKLLGKLVNQHHPKMKETVVKEVELLLFRQHIPELAQFYGLCFLSQILLEPRDKELASRMVNIYFNFFDSATKKTNKDVKNRMMNVLITGLTRASPYATMEAEILEKRLESFYKVIHLVNQNTAVQGMVLIFNLMETKESGLISDRLYTLLYRSLLEINMETCTRRALYLNLLFKAMKRDSIPHRVKAFLKRLLQIALYQPPSIVCAIMVLLSSLVKSKPELLSTFKPARVATICDEQDEDEKYEDIELDEEEEEKILKKQKGKQNSKVKKGKDSKKNSTKEKEVKKMTKEDDEAKKASTSWVHNANLKKDQESSGDYDLMARNPLFANTKFSVNWELTLLRHHFHPSANMFAQKTIDGESIDYDGDPLQDFTLKRFIDRFVFRNPKKINRQQAAQSSKSTLFARLNNSVVTPIQELSKSNKTSVPLEEQFIYDYLVQKNKEIEDREKDDDNESVASEDFERLLRKIEPNLDNDDDFMKVKKDKRKGGDDESGTDDSDDDMFSDDDFDIDSDDDYYREAFDGVDEDLADAQYDDKTTFLSDDDVEEVDSDLEIGESDEEDMETSRFKRRGRDKNLVNLFAAADKFSHLLEGKESDDEKKNGSDDEDDNGNNRKRGKRKPPSKRSNNQKGKMNRQKRRR